MGNGECCPYGDGGAAGASRSLSREPGIPLALLQGTVELSAGAQTQEPWLGWELHSSRGSELCVCTNCPNFPWDGEEMAVFIHGAEGSSG